MVRQASGFSDRCWILDFGFWIAVGVALQRFVQTVAKGDPTPSEHGTRNTQHSPMPYSLRLATPN
jgi:hypothetical protein